MNTNIQIEKTYSITGDVHVDVVLDGELITRSLWCGESDQELCDEAANFLIARYSDR